MDTKQSDANEQVLREYFEARTGWTVTKLPAGKKGKAADFRICSNDTCLLCEVKSVESDRANFPYTPLNYYLEERERRKVEVEKLRREDPDKQVLLRKDEWEFIYGDEIEFSKKYRDVRRNTRYWFARFAQDMQEYFVESNIKDLPYDLTLDSDDLYQPTPDEQHTLFSWIESEIAAIHKGTPSRQWDVQRWSNHVASYSVSYQVHKPIRKNDREAVYELIVTGPRETGGLEVHVHSYGTLNLERITSNIEAGTGQLERSASREKDPQIPRVIALMLKSGIEDWVRFSSFIASLLKEHPNLSAIVVLDCTADGIPPPREAGLLAWVQFHSTTAVVPSFVVYHNSWLQGVKPLPIEAFKDKWSIQLCPIKSGYA
jgi:hypothetical protein